MPKVVRSASGSASKFISFGSERFVMETGIRKKLRKWIFALCVPLYESRIVISCWSPQALT